MPDTDQDACAGRVNAAAAVGYRCVQVVAGLAQALGDAHVLTMSISTRDACGRGIEFGSHVYRADRYAFHRTVRTGHGMS